MNNAVATADEVASLRDVGQEAPVWLELRDVVDAIATWPMLSIEPLWLQLFDVLNASQIAAHLSIAPASARQ